MSKCLYCYQDLEDGQEDFHPACARKFFGIATAPAFPYTRDNMSELAHQVIRTSASVTGVQAITVGRWCFQKTLLSERPLPLAGQSYQPRCLGAHHRAPDTGARSVANHRSVIDDGQWAPLCHCFTQSSIFKSLI